MCGDFVWVISSTYELDTDRVIAGFRIFKRLQEVLWGAMRAGSQ